MHLVLRKPPSPPFYPLPTFDKTLFDGRPIIEGLADYDNDMLKGGLGLRSRGI